MRSLWAAGMLLRRLRAERGIILLIVVLVAATSFVFAAGPRLFNRTADAGLQQALAIAPPAQRNVTMRLDTRLESAGSDIAVPLEYGAELGEQIPASVSALITERLLVVTTVRLLIPDPPDYETHLSLRYQEGLENATRLVDGRWPVDLGMPLLPLGLDGDGGQGAPGQPAPPAEPAVFEIAFSASQATELGIELGDEYDVVLDQSDPLIRGRAFRVNPAQVVVVGLFEPLDPDGAYWSGDASLLMADQRGDEDEPLAYATAAVAREAYSSLWTSELPFHYEWRFQVDAARLDADQVTTLQSDLPRLDRIGGAGAVAAPGQIGVRTGLGAILEQFMAQRSLAASVLSIAAIGPFALATGAMAMVAILLARRRAATLSLVRGRGASGALLLGTQLWEALILTGAAALVGLGLAVLAIPARMSPLSAPLAIAVAVTATGLLVGASWTAARRGPGQPERDDASAVRRVSPRRLVIEGTIVAVAIAATLLLRQRGLVIDGEGSEGADPLLASVPVLAGLAAGIVALRLYPVPIRAFSWLAARRRDLVPVLGLRTIGRRSGAANLPLLALMLTAAFGTFTSIVASSLDRGQLTSTYQQVGADYRLEPIGSNEFTFVDAAAVPGVEAAAPAFVDLSAPFAASSRQRATIFLDALDAPGYAAVTAGTAADPKLPLSFFGEPATEGLGTPENPIPAILSTNLPSGTNNLVAGDPFQITIAGEALTFRLLERRDRFAGLSSSDFAVVPLAWVKAALDDEVLLPTRIWVRAGPDAAPAIAAAMGEAAGTARIVSRHAAYAALRDISMGQAVIAGYTLALIVAAVYMALTIIGALILSAARRTRDTAYLRTLGVSASQSLALTVMEHGPPVLLALIPGIALGTGVAMLTLPSLGLGTFAATVGPLPPFVDVAALAVLAVGLVALVAVAVAAGTWLSRRARLVNALRMGDD